MELIIYIIFLCPLTYGEFKWCMNVIMNMMQYIWRTGFNSCPVRSSKLGMPCCRSTCPPGGGEGIAGIASLMNTTYEIKCSHQIGVIFDNIDYELVVWFSKKNRMISISLIVDGVLSFFCKKCFSCVSPLEYPRHANEIHMTSSATDYQQPVNSWLNRAVIPH